MSVVVGVRKSARIASKMDISKTFNISENNLDCIDKVNGSKLIRMQQLIDELRKENERMREENAELQNKLSQLQLQTNLDDIGTSIENESLKGEIVCLKSIVKTLEQERIKLIEHASARVISGSSENVAAIKRDTIEDFMKSIQYDELRMSQKMVLYAHFLRTNENDTVPIDNAVEHKKAIAGLLSDDDFMLYISVSCEMTKCERKKIVARVLRAYKTMCAIYLKMKLRKDESA
jgi:hypothetical protein